MTENLITLAYDNVNATLNKSLEEDVIVVYTTTNCASCKALKMTIDNMLNTKAINNKQIYLFNMDSEPNMNYGVDLGIRSIPCLIKYTKGTEVKRGVGAKSPTDILEMLAVKEKVEL